MQNKLSINFILLSRIFFFLNIPEHSFSWMFQNIPLSEYSASRIFHFQNIPLLEYSTSRIFYFQNTLFLEHSSNRMFYQRTINASRSHVDSTLLSTISIHFQNIYYGSKKIDLFETISKSICSITITTTKINCNESTDIPSQHLHN